MEAPSSETSGVVKMVVNQSFGRFGLSDLAVQELSRLGVENAANRGVRSGYRIERHDPRLVQVVENLGMKAASASHSQIIIEDVPAILFPYCRVDKYDGLENIEYDWRRIFSDFANKLTAENASAIRAEMHQFLDASATQ